MKIITALIYIFRLACSFRIISDLDNRALTGGFDAEGKWQAKLQPNDETDGRQLW